MKTKIFNGKKIANQMIEALSDLIDNDIMSKINRIPKLVSIRIGNDYGSEVYSDMQKKVSERVGIKFEDIKFGSKVKPSRVIKKIDKLNKSKDVDGIFIHQPLPEGFLLEEIRRKVAEFKDVECEHPSNLGVLFNENCELVPPTSAAILTAIKQSGIEVKGKNVVIIGHSNIVGKPTALMLLNKLATVTVTHIGTYEANNLLKYTQEADILISAVGKPNFVKKDWIKDHSIVIDVGINDTSDGVTGDVDYESIIGKASFVTPVPGGIGPLTVVFLMKNLVTLVKNKYYEQK